MNTWIYKSLTMLVPSWCQGPYTVTMFATVETTSPTESASARFDDATLNGNTLLFAEDSLGSTRVVTDTSGVVCYDADFYPFGGERPYTNNCTPQITNSKAKNATKKPATTLSALATFSIPQE